MKASSSLASAPASCMWYPETEIELNLGMCCAWAGEEGGARAKKR